MWCNFSARKLVLCCFTNLLSISHTERFIFDRRHYKLIPSPSTFWLNQPVNHRKICKCQLSAIHGFHKHTKVAILASETELCKISNSKKYLSLMRTVHGISLIQEWCSSFWAGQACVSRRSLNCFQEFLNLRLRWFICINRMGDDGKCQVSTERRTLDLHGRGSKF